MKQSNVIYLKGFVHIEHQSFWEHYCQSSGLLHPGAHRYFYYYDVTTLGLNEAVVLSVVEYQIKENAEKCWFMLDGKVYFPTTIRKFQRKYVPFLSQETIRKCFSTLCEKNILERLSDERTPSKRKNKYLVWYTLTNVRRLRIEMFESIRNSSEDEGENPKTWFKKENRIYPFDPYLAAAIGLKESIILQQIHFWLRHNFKEQKNIYNHMVWTYNSFSKWQAEYFKFMSLSALKRAFQNLRNRNLLLTFRHNKKSYDRTLWYTINYKLLEKHSNGFLKFDWKNFCFLPTEKYEKYGDIRMHRRSIFTFDKKGRSENGSMEA